MAAPNTPVSYDDFVSVLSGGQNSGVNPLLLTKDQFAFGLNLSLRGGYAHTRAPVVKINLNYAGRDDIQAIVENGYFQGGGYYRPDSGVESLIAQISGHLLKFTQGNSGWDVTDISVPGDLNNATTPQVWMWQAERWMIVNDGTGVLPIFYDGVFSRRSYGPSIELGVTAADFTPPPIGDTVDITLTSTYAGPFNIPIILNGAFYQPISFKVNSGPAFNAVLTNLSGPAGVNFVSEDQLGNHASLFARASVVGVIMVDVSMNFGSGFAAIGTITQTLTLASPYLGAIGQHVTITGIAFEPGIKGWSNGNTLVWSVSAVNGNQITIVNVSQIGSSNHPDPDNLPVNGFHYPVGQIFFFNGNNSPDVRVASLGADFTIPAIGSTVAINTLSAYTGPANQIIYMTNIGNGQTNEFSIVYQPPAPPSAIITVLNLTDTTNNPEPQYPTAAFAPQQLLSVPELPAGRMGAYGMGRNWFSLIDGISYEAGDIVGGAAGTQAYNFRDSVLKTTENDFLAGGGTFRLPGAGDQITAMCFPPILDKSLGQGECQIFTSVTCFSNNSPVDRAVWETLTSPILTESLKDNGALAQNSTVLINSDTFFRSFVGYGSLVLARRDFGGWGNKTISNEMQRPLLADNQSLLQFGSAISFDNRFISTAAPNLIGAGVFHVGQCVLNFDLISSLRTNLPPAWEGAWSGINTMQLITGRVNGVNRCFSFTFDLNNNKIELWEQLSETAANQAQTFEDNGDTPILSLFETAVLFNKDVKPLTELVEITEGEIYISNITDTLNVKVYYRPDFYPCWTLWREFNLAADDDNTTGDGNKQPGYRMRIGLGQPSASDCEPGNNRPLRNGFFHQFRVEFTGYCVFRGLRVRARTFPQTALAPVQCEDDPTQLIDCKVPDDLQIYSLQGFIPQPPPQNAPDLGKFFNLQVVYPNVCSSGSPAFSGVLPSWITLDSAGNQFFGRASVFRGVTQAAANAEAQANLNNFVSQQIALGNITCSMPVIVPDKLWYKFPEGSGTTTQDFSASGNNGTGINAATAWGFTGPNGNGALNFDGTHAFTTVGASNWAGTTPTHTDFSYSIWVKKTTPAPSSSYFDLIDATVDGFPELALDDTNTTNFQVNASGVLGGFGTLATGTWGLITVTFNHVTTVLTFYLNGVNVGTITASLNPGFSSFTDGFPVFIGESDFYSNFNGLMADLRVYGRVLTGTEVASIFSSGAL